MSHTLTVCIRARMWNAVSSVTSNVFGVGEGGDMWGMEFAVCAFCVDHVEKLISLADF